VRPCLTPCLNHANPRARGPNPCQELWLQIHRDIGQIPHQRRQRLLRYCPRNPQIQQGDVIVPRRALGRPRLQRHPEDGHGRRPREEGLLWLRSNVGGRAKRRRCRTTLSERDEKSFHQGEVIYHTHTHNPRATPCARPRPALVIGGIIQGIELMNLRLSFLARTRQVNKLRFPLPTTGLLVPITPIYFLPLLP
jgi:hypothetical protein